MWELIRKIEFYKKLLIGFTAVAVMSIVVGGYLYIEHISFELEKIEKLEEVAQQAESRQYIEQEVLELIDDFDAGSADFKKGIWQLEVDLKETPFYTSRIKSVVNREEIKKEDLFHILGALHSYDVRKMTASLDRQKALANLKTRIFVTSVLTLIFGVLLPIVVFIRLKHHIESLRSELVEKVEKLVQQYFNLSNSKGTSESRKWLYLSLLALELVAPHTKMTGLQLGAEFSFLVRQELKKRDETLRSAS